MMLSTIAIFLVAFQAVSSQDPMYMGCFKDNADRALSYNHPRGVRGVKECILECRTKGFPYAGVQYTTQCFCGSDYDRYGPSNGCDHRCNNDREICGGVWANSVYKTDIRYVGCFVDKPQRDMSYYHRGNVEDIESCIAVCNAKGYNYAGLQYGGQCFCGQSYGRYGVSKNCNMKCYSGIEICGGTWANAVYKTDPNYVGCFVDKATRDLLYFHRNNPIRDIDTCIRMCKEKGYPYAGIQYRTQCFCGFKYGRYGQSKNCNAKCIDTPDMCGGTWANAIYKTDYRYVDCVKDSANRALPFLSLIKPYSIRSCINECKKRGYLYAGLQNGNQCFCGSNPTKHGRTSSCNKKCMNGVDTCGGHWAMSVYATI